MALAAALEVGADDLLFETTRTTRGEALEDVLSILDGCSAEQLKVLKDILGAAKRSMDKYL